MSGFIAHQANLYAGIFRNGKNSFLCSWLLGSWLLVFYLFKPNVKSKCFHLKSQTRI